MANSYELHYSQVVIIPKKKLCHKSILVPPQSLIIPIDWFYLWNIKALLRSQRGCQSEKWWCPKCGITTSWGPRGSCRWSPLQWIVVQSCVITQSTIISQSIFFALLQFFTYWHITVMVWVLFCRLFHTFSRIRGTYRFFFSFFFFNKKYANFHETALSTAQRHLPNPSRDDITH